MKILSITFLFSFGIYFSNAQSLKFEYSTKKLSNSIGSFEVYYFDPDNIDETQLIAILNNKAPFDNCGFALGFTIFSPSYKGEALPNLSYNYYKNDTLLINPVLSHYFFLHKELNSIDIYFNIIQNGNTKGVEDDSNYYIGPITFNKVKIPVIKKSTNKKMVFANDKFKVKEITKHISDSLSFVQVEFGKISWAEYDTSRQFKRKTTPKLLSDSKGQFNNRINELSPNTRYFYRFVLMDGIYVSYANIRETKTLPLEEISKYLFIPDTMQINKPNKITFGITKKDLLRLLRNYQYLQLYFSEEDLVKAKSLIVTLIDTSNSFFSIKPISTSDQMVNDSLITQWSWFVIPNKSGCSKLSLDITLVFSEGNKNVPFPFGEKKVFVIETVFEKTYNFFINNWQWILATIFIPFIVWLFTKRKKKRVQKNKNGNKQQKKNK